VKKVAKAHPSISPSKTLVGFANEITSLQGGAVVDAPCGYGRNAIAMALRGCKVLAIDNDRKRLAALDQVKGAYVGQDAPNSIATGEIVSVCADLTPDGWPLGSSSVSAIICVHFAMIELIPTFLSSLQEGGYLYIETFGGQGQNFRDLPKAKQLKELLSSQVEFRYYKERKVGPSEADSVVVTLFARRRRGSDGH
jgi:SAM-dependent methyltransferase